MINIATKNTGDSLTASEFNQLPSEIQNAVESAGQILSSITTDQLSKGITDLVANADFYTDGGSANTYVLSAISPNKPPTSLRNGMLIRFRATNNNTGASTINVTTLGVIDIKQEDGTSDLTANQIITTKDTYLRYNGSVFILVKEINATIQVQGVQYIHKQITISNNGTDSNNDIDFSIGNAVSFEGSNHILLSSTLTKKLDVAWASGNNAGGFVSISGHTSKEADEMYPLFVIKNLDNGVVDAIFIHEDALDNAILDKVQLTSAGYTSLQTATGWSNILYRYVGSISTDISTNIIKFYKYGNYIAYDYYTIEASPTPTSNVWNTYTLYKMPKMNNIVGYGKAYQNYEGSTSGLNLQLFIKRTGSVAGQGQIYSGIITGGSVGNEFIGLLPMNLRQVDIKFEFTAPADDWIIYTFGYYDYNI